MQAYIEKHLLGMTSLLPPCLALWSCATSVTFLAFLAMPSPLLSSTAWTCPCLADKLPATRMPHSVGGKQIFFLHTLLVIKAKMNFLKIPLLFLQHHHSWTSWSNFFFQFILPESFLFQVWQQTPWAAPLSLQQLPLSPKAQGSLISQNNLTAGGDSSCVGWRCAVLDITKLRCSSPSESTIWGWTVSHPWEEGNSLLWPVLGFSNSAFCWKNESSFSNINVSSLLKIRENVVKKKKHLTLLKGRKKSPVP